MKFIVSHQQMIDEVVRVAMQGGVGGAKWIPQISYYINTLFDYPYETLENTFKTAEFTIKVSYWKILAAGMFVTYPETVLTQKAIKEGLIDLDYYEKLNKSEYHHNKTLVRSKDIDKIINLGNFIYLLIWFPFIFPLAKILIHLKPNAVYRSIFDLGLGVNQVMIFQKCKW